MGGLKPSGFSATQHTLIRRLPMPTTASTYNHLIALLPRNYERIHQQAASPSPSPTGDEVISDLLLSQLLVAVACRYHGMPRRRE